MQRVNCHEDIVAAKWKLLSTSEMVVARIEHRRRRSMVCDCRWSRSTAVYGVSLNVT